MHRRHFDKGRAPHTGRTQALRYLLPLLLMALLAACKPPEDRTAASSTGNLVISAELPANPAVGPAPITVTVTRADGTAVTNATVRVEGDMSHAGMVPVLADAVEAGDGVYRADDMRFTMAGDWFITVTVTEASGSTDASERSTATLPITVRR